MFNSVLSVLCWRRFAVIQFLISITQLLKVSHRSRYYLLAGRTCIFVYSRHINDMKYHVSSKRRQEEVYTMKTELDQEPNLEVLRTLRRVILISCYLYLRIVVCFLDMILINLRLFLLFLIFSLTD